MVLKPRIDIPYERLAEFCKRHKVTELSLFGSALRDDFRPDSDIDLLFLQDPEARTTLFDLFDMTEELEQIFGRKVDFVPKDGLKTLVAREVLPQAVLLYAA